MCVPSQYWQVVMSNMVELRDRGLYCDLQIECEGRVLNVHKIVVAAGLEYFRNMLSSRMLEALNNRVSLEGFSFEAIREILNFAYTGHIELDDNNVWEIFRAANFLLVEQLQERCVDFFINHLTVENCLQIRELAYESSSSKLAELVDQFVRCNFEGVYRNPQIGIFEAEDLERILLDDALISRNESHVLEAVLNWFDFSRERRAEELSKLLKAVRFAYVTPNDLEQVLQRFAEFSNSFKVLSPNNWEKGFLSTSTNGVVMLGSAVSVMLFKPQGDGVPVKVRRSRAGKTRSLTRENQKRTAVSKTRSLECSTVDVEKLIRRVEEAHALRVNNNLSGLPELSRLHSAGVLVCLGGRREQLSPCEFVEVYSPQADHWSWVQEVPFAGRQVGVTVIGTKVYLIGGHNGYVASSSTCGVLDVRSGEYLFLPAMSSNRRGVGVTQLDDRYVYAVGGQSAETSNEVQRFDTLENKWEDVAPLTIARRSLNAMAVGRHVYAIGGCTAGETSYVASVERYDPETNGWEEVAPMHHARYSMGSAAIGNRLYVVGGFGDGGALRNCEYFDTETKVWHEISPLKTGRGGVGVAEMGGRLYAVGGYDGQYLKSMEVYDPQRNEWTECASIHDPRAGCGVAHVQLCVDEVPSLS